ncbi:MAG: helix-turn-helix domain-containing protein [Anaerostipes sp.]|jgi:putative transcriptional regulator
MMSFDPLWETLKKKDITTYRLIKEYNLSRGMLDKLKHNRNVTLETVNWLCTTLDCRVEDVVVYRKEK